MSQTKKWIIRSLIALIVVAIGGGGFYYFYQQQRYITTDDAKVTGDIVTVSSTASGTIIDWKGKEGTTFQKGDLIGKIHTGNQVIEIKAPADGTIIKSNTSNGQLTAAGQPLAQMVNLDQLYIKANIEETNLTDVHVGQTVHVTVDAIPDQKIKGKVSQIGKATNSVFSLLPMEYASGDYTKVVQRIPIKIDLKTYPKTLIPGMNATIQIQK